ncbi:hypothetical protein D9756_004985 [Leucocoprinus leucothites]|uniref:Uncharacterized protein n=1 Tax=Leucocoprinus leucothites TaxID=201217 RepID=A0A8H5LKQ8_9AGAR|nr:hypothetical protein D9756_004985 [Leucoagaricus leucothites]
MELEPVFRAIWDGADKIKRLVSALNSKNWIALLSRGFQQLEELVVQAPLPWLREIPKTLQPSATLWSSMPCLKHVVLKGLYHHDLDACLRLLLLCTSLVEYRVRSTHAVEPNPAIHPTFGNHDVTFHHIKRFTVYCAFHQPFFSALPHLRLPVLEELGLGAVTPNSIINLHLVLNFLAHAIKNILTAIPVVNLSLLFTDTSALTTILQRLTNGFLYYRETIPVIESHHPLYSPESS